MQTEMSSSPTGGLCLPAGKHASILKYFQTKINKKTAKNVLFLSPFFLLKYELYLVQSS